TNPTGVLEGKKDSSLVTTQLSVSSGNAVFTNLSAGDYFFRITHLSFTDYISSHFFITENFELQLPPVLLRTSSSTLNTATVSARKPFIEIKPGKTVVNVEAGISNAGSTAMEALEKMPGIT